MKRTHVINGQTWVVVGQEFTGRRLRARYVSEDSVVLTAIGSGLITVRHGGGVANSYGYRAETEAVLAVPLLEHRVVVVWTARLYANNVRLCGAAGACLPVARDLFLERASDEKKWAARQRIVGAAQAAVASLRGAADIAALREEATDAA